MRDICVLFHHFCPTNLKKYIFSNYHPIFIFHLSFLSKFNEIDWLIGCLTDVNTEMSMCANCEAGILAQAAKDGQRDTLYITLRDLMPVLLLYLPNPI